MKAWAVTGHSLPLQNIDIADREPVGTEVLLAVTHAGVCHSDLHFWNGYYNVGGAMPEPAAGAASDLPRGCAMLADHALRPDQFRPRRHAGRYRLRNRRGGQSCAATPWLRPPAGG